MQVQIIQFFESSVSNITLGSAPISGLTYFRSPAILLSNITNAQPTFTGVNNAANYTYTMEASNGACKAYDAINITVIPKPGVNINATGSTCSVNFSASVVGIGVKGPINYNWVFGTSPDATPSTANGAGPINVVYVNGGNKNI